MKTFILLLTFISTTAFANISIECVSPQHKITVKSNSAGLVKVTFKGETVEADGILNRDEVDLVARFKSIGEMTLFAKVGQSSPENYIFIQSTRFPVNCR